MQHRKLGKNGPEIPVVGFGGWPIGEGMGHVDEATALETVQAALDRGLTLIDTAQYYKSSEGRIGKILTKSGYREKCFLATKVSFDYSRSGVKTAFENSLRELKTDYIDLYQIHMWDETVPVEETLEAMTELQERGKIKYIGVSNFRVEHLRRALKAAPIVSNQINYNMFLRTPERELFPFCKENGIGIMVHSTLAKGYLSGKYDRNYRFPADDERSTFRQYQGKDFDRYMDAVKDLQDIAREKDWSLIELAIAWSLRKPEVSTALVGIKNPAQIDAPLAAGDRTLTLEDIAKIDAVLQKHDLENLAPFESQIV
jgi:aryl-alcohol dehydrogenase-like predicted oxidoreductase